MFLPAGKKSRAGLLVGPELPLFVCCWLAGVWTPEPIHCWLPGGGYSFLGSSPLVMFCLLTNFFVSVGNPNATSSACLYFGIYKVKVKYVAGS